MNDYNTMKPVITRRAAIATTVVLAGTLGRAAEPVARVLALAVVFIIVIRFKCSFSHFRCFDANGTSSRLTVVKSKIGGLWIPECCTE